MRIPGLSRLRRAVQWAVPKHPVILMYHRIADARLDPWGLSVSPIRFSEHLEVLCRTATPVALADLISEGGRTRRRRAIAITFDDGYADNFHAALPLLRRRGVPATVFVTTGFLGSQRAPWWDELADLLLVPGRLPEFLELTIGGNRHRWALGAAADYGEDRFHRDRHWRALTTDPPTPRHRAYAEIWHLLWPLPEAEQRPVLDELATWAGRATEAARPDHSMLTESEVTTLGRDKLIEIGAHSVSHPILSGLPLEAQRREVTECKGRLEQVVGSAVRSFAYPYGQASKLTESLVRAAGFERACGTQAGEIGSSADLFHLPRIAVQNWDGEQFARTLASMAP